MNFSVNSCRLKRTSPTAYCDCWEKCKCKTLIAGQKSARLDLLYRLLTATNLVTLPNSRQVGFLGCRINQWKELGTWCTSPTLTTCCLSGESTSCCSWYRLSPGRQWSTVSTGRPESGRIVTGKQPVLKVSVLNISNLCAKPRILCLSDPLVLLRFRYA